MKALFIFIAIIGVFDVLLIMGSAKIEKERKIDMSVLTKIDEQKLAEAVAKESQLVKADDGKPKISLVPTQIIYDIAIIREYGNRKYPTGGKDNWKQVAPERYVDAAFRHLLAYKDDPNSVDEESGYSHLWHLACNVAFLCEMEKSDQHEMPEYAPWKEAFNNMTLQVERKDNE